MSATIYFRILGVDSSQVNLVVAKTTVAPLKTQTISRLELCAALILCRLVSGLLGLFEFSNVPLHLWTDSTVALSWITSEPYLWQVFVSHRVAGIQIMSKCFMASY